MSHQPERKEKDCLNCGAEVQGRFCHVCGQENAEPKQTTWALITHFFYDITHFDGKFFSTVKYLVRKPGFLPKEYIKGRRAFYLHPIRMYVFSSALFFAIFFSLFNVKSLGIGKEEDNAGEKDKVSSQTSNKQKALRNAKTKEDSLRIETYFNGIHSYLAPGIKKDSSNTDTLGRQKEKQKALKKAKTFYDSVSIEAYYGAVEATEKAKKEGNQVYIEPYIEDDYENLKFNAKFDSKAAYDSAQKALPKSQRDGWFKRLVNYRSIELNKKYHHQSKQFLRDLADKFIHTFPYLLFVSLPLYALFLKLLYVRQKKFYYVDHGIFLVYLYIFTFLILLIMFSLNALENLWNTNWIWLLQTALIVYGVVYTVKAMRNFYEQGRGKTILKFTLLNIMAFISLTILFTLFFILTVFRV